MCIMYFTGHDLDHVQGAVYDVPRTPLEIALDEGFLDSVRVLLQAGAKMSWTKAQKLLDDPHKHYELDNGKTLADKIQALMSGVHSLKQMARCIVMSSLSDTTRIKDVDLLPVNDEIKDFLRYSDL